PPHPLNRRNFPEYIDHSNLAFAEEAHVARPMTIEPALLRLMEGVGELDTSLPYWARRSNPIVRRQLGIYWKTLPLELSHWLKILGGEMLLVIVAGLLPSVYTFIMPVVTVSVLL